MSKIEGNMIQKGDSDLSNAEIKLIRNYLTEVKLTNFALRKEAAAEIKKIDNKQYNQIDLYNRIYDCLLNYSVLYLDARKGSEVKLFKGLIDKVRDNKLFYGNGIQEYNGKNLSMYSDLKPLEVAAHANTDSANIFACILAEYGYGTKNLEEGETIVHIAVNAKNIRLLTMLRSQLHIDFNMKDMDGNTALCKPVWELLRGNFVEGKIIIKNLIDLGADINYTGIGDNNMAFAGDTILHTLVESGFIHPLEVVKNYGANFGIKDRAGNTLAHHAIIYGQIKILDYLIDQGYGINDYNHIQGYTTLGLLINHGMYDYVKKIIDAGANVNYRNNKNISALNQAVEFARSVKDNDIKKYNEGINIIKILFDKGYKLTLHDYSKIVELDRAGYSEIMQEIVKANAKNHKVKKVSITRYVYDNNSDVSDQGYTSDEELAIGEDELVEIGNINDEIFINLVI